MTECDNYSRDTISVMRGDTAMLDLTILNGASDSVYFLKENDRVIFTVAYRGEAVIRKSYKQPDQDSAGVIRIRLAPEDTFDLNFYRGVYDVRLETGDEVMTVIMPSVFVMIPGAASRSGKGKEL